jgi:hypothetical protein
MDENEQLTSVETGAEQQVAAEPTHSETGAEANVSDQSGNERVDTAFAKRLAAERTKMEKEYAERYKDYDTYKEVGEYFRELNEADDVMSLKERIEMERLQQRAEQAQVSPEVQRRLEELEAKAAEADQLKENQKLQDFYKGFRNDLEKFAGEKKVDANELEKFMAEKRIPDMDIAYKAMTYADAEAKAEEIKQNAIKEYLQSKKAPKVEGAGTPGHIPPAPPKTWQEANARAAEMIRAARQQS